MKKLMFLFTGVHWTTMTGPELPHSAVSIKKKVMLAVLKKNLILRIHKCTYFQCKIEKIS